MRGSIIEKRWFKITYTIIAIAAFAAIALVIMHLVAGNGIHPGGPESLYHIYRGELIYEGVGSGNWYPLYDPNWFNGVEIMRYQAPLCPYFYAFCMEIASYFLVQYYGGYIVYAGMIFFLGAIVWFIIGKIMRRPFVGTALAVLWFFMPNNLYALFGEGNLAKSLCLVILPLFVFAAYSYLNNGLTRYLVIITVSFMLISLCDQGFAGMLAISLLVYLLFDMFISRRYLKDLRIIISTVLGYAITGIWTIPCLIGGISQFGNSEDAGKFFQNILISINPFYRITDNLDTVYFGLAAALLALAGVFFSYKKSRPGFWLGFLILILSSDIMYNVVRLLPGSPFLLMLKYVSIAMCFILMSFMMWTTLRRPIMITVLVLLAIDTIPSFYYIIGNGDGTPAEERLYEYGDETLLNRAREITSQRLCILDEGELAAIGPYIPSSGAKGVKTSSGVKWETSEIAKNVTNINRGMDGQGYFYAFDRALELGNDAVLVVLLGDEPEHIKEIDSAAQFVGYSLDSESKAFRLYSLKKSHPEEWGVVTEYKAIGIGAGSETIARQFPYMKEGGSDILDDYTFEDLKGYELIYLSAFEFRNRQYAEDLVVRLSEAGVRILIAADGVPEDRSVAGRIFLGVICNPISFSQGFPLLETIEGELDTDLFPADNREWNTYFCDGLDHVWGKVKDENYDIPFLGTVKNDNIIFVGLNLTFYYGLTRDEGVEKLLGNVMSLSTSTLPDRKIVPVEIEYEPDRITITSEYANLDTTLAYHDFFNLDKSEYEDNHLLYVPKGVTEINLSYPMMAPGLICTLLSIIFAVMYLLAVYLREIRKRTEQERREILAEIERQKTLERRRNLAEKNRQEKKRQDQQIDKKWDRIWGSSESDRRVRHKSQRRRVK
ncbi:MAG: hypothetical protein IK152_07700 [Lachnospiraceae bacterium]|nr:hypothetical protein [Lachnospiraceae bacterium]